MPLFGKPLGVGDFNNDGRVDIIAGGKEASSAADGLWVIPGNGNGTFRTPVLIDRLTPTFGLVADFNNDGKRDIAVGEEGYSLHIYPGNGDFTFGPRQTLTTGAFPHGGVAADFNADGKPDIAVAPALAAELDVYINMGGLLFTSSVIPLASRTATDATVADLNRDGRRDLVVSLIPPDLGAEEYEDGSVGLLLGKGDGTFAAPVEYPTAPGAISVVVGDFNRDGLTDVATGNQSFRVFDCLSYPFHLWDSISILPGIGTGTFARATTFSLGRQDQNNVEGM
jgi:hypothetical protein